MATTSAVDSKLSTPHTSLPFDTIPINQAKYPDGISPTRHNTHQHEELKKKKKQAMQILRPAPQKNTPCLPFSNSPQRPLFDDAHHLYSSPASPKILQQQQKMAKTYNSGYSLVVTHLTTNPPVRCLNRAERTGSLVFNVLWSYVSVLPNHTLYIPSACIAHRLLTYKPSPLWTTTNKWLCGWWQISQQAPP